MRKILIVILVAFNFNLIAQDTTFYNDQDYKEFIFGNLSENLFPTGFLLDRNSHLYNNWEKFKVNPISEVEDVLDVNNWFEIHQYLRYAQVQEGNFIHLDSLMWPLYDQIFWQVDSDGEVELPLFIADYDVNRFHPQAEENGNILFYSNQFHEGINPEAGVIQEHIYFAGLTMDTIQNPNVALELDQEYFLSNRGKMIDFVRFEINGYSHDVYMNDIVSLTPYIQFHNLCTINLFYTDGEVITSEFEFFYEPVNLRLGTLGELQLFDEVGEIDNSGSSANNPKLRYGIKFGCGNSELRKPVIFVAGFGMASHNVLIQFAGQSDCSELYDKYNLDGLMDELMESGHDVIVARFIPAVGSLIEGADRITELIELVNQRKFANNSYVENMIIGYSAGAIAVRYALDQMEHEHMFYNGPHPHTKLYVSFEGEHEGASIPLGMQLMLKYLYENHGSLQTNVIHYMANSPQAKQLLKHYWPETGKVGNPPPFTSGQGPDPWREVLMDDMEITYAHNKQTQKYGYSGYPAFTRNVAIVNGARNTGSFNGDVVVNDPYAFNYGHIVMFQENLYKKWQVYLYSNSQQEGNTNNPKTVYRYVEFNFWGNVTFVDHYKTNTDLLLYDNGPGGFLTGDDDMLIKVMDKAAGQCIDGCIPGDPQIYSFRTTSFTPVISCLDIRNYSPFDYDRQLHYDLWDNNLLRFEFGVQDQGSWGYPVLGNPIDHYDITPFQAIYADEFNQTHIASWTPTTVGVPGASDFTFGQQPQINDFMFREFEYKKIYLQNSEVGWNTNGAEYKAEYEAQNSIYIGQEVTPKTDIAPYNVLTNGNIICHAGETVEISEGFYAEVGSQFHAYIEPLACQFTTGGPSASIQLPTDDKESYESVSSTLEIEESENLSFYSVYPNPNNGVFAIKTNSSETLVLSIYNLSGKELMTLQVNSDELINLSLTSGVYIVRIEGKENTSIKKMIVN